MIFYKILSNEPFKATLNHDDCLDMHLQLITQEDGVEAYECARCHQRWPQDTDIYCTEI